MSAPAELTQHTSTQAQAMPGTTTTVHPTHVQPAQVQQALNQHPPAPSTVASIDQSVNSQSGLVFTEEVKTILRGTVSTISRNQNLLPKGFLLHLFLETQSPTDMNDVEAKVLYSPTCSFQQLDHRGAYCISQGLALYRMAPVPTIPSSIAGTSTSQQTTQLSTETTDSDLTSSAIQIRTIPSVPSTSVNASTTATDLGTSETHSDAGQIPESEKAVLQDQFDRGNDILKSQNLLPWFPGEAEEEPKPQVSSDDKDEDDDNSDGEGNEREGGEVEGTVEDGTRNSSGTTNSKNKKGRKKSRKRKKKDTPPPFVKADSNNTTTVNGLITHALSTVQPKQVHKIYQLFFKTLHDGIRHSSYYKSICLKQNWKGRHSYKFFTAPWIRTYLKISTPQGASHIPVNPLRIRAVPDAKNLRNAVGCNIALAVLSSFYDKEPETRVFLRKITLDVSGILLPLHPGQVILSPQGLVPHVDSRVVLSQRPNVPGPVSQSQREAGKRSDPQPHRALHGNNNLQSTNLNPPSTSPSNEGEDEPPQISTTSLGSLQIIEQPIPNESPLPPQDLAYELEEAERNEQTQVLEHDEAHTEETNPVDKINAALASCNDLLNDPGQEHSPPGPPTSVLSPPTIDVQEQQQPGSPNTSGSPPQQQQPATSEEFGTDNLSPIPSPPRVPTNSPINSPQQPHLQNGTSTNDVHQDPCQNGKSFPINNREIEFIWNRKAARTSQQHETPKKSSVQPSSSSTSPNGNGERRRSPRLKDRNETTTHEKTQLTHASEQPSEVRKETHSDRTAAPQSNGHDEIRPETRAEPQRKGPRTSPSSQSKQPMSTAQQQTKKSIVPEAKEPTKRRKDANAITTTSAATHVPRTSPPKPKNQSSTTQQQRKKSISPKAKEPSKRKKQSTQTSTPPATRIPSSSPPKPRNQSSAPRQQTKTSISPQRKEQTKSKKNVSPAATSTATHHANKTPSVQSTRLAVLSSQLQATTTTQTRQVKKSSHTTNRTEKRPASSAASRKLPPSQSISKQSKAAPQKNRYQYYKGRKLTRKRRSGYIGL